MPEFIYVARNRNGDVVRGEIEDRNQERAVRRLHARDLTVTALEVVRPRHWIWSVVQPVRRDIVVLLARQLAAMLAAGVPVTRAIESLLPGLPRVLRKPVDRVYVGVCTGFTLSQSLRRAPQIFSSFLIGAVQIGEASGHLPETLERCAHHLEQEHTYAMRLKAALVYPCVLMTACALLVGFIFTYMIPRFVELFVDLHMDLPWPTRLLLGGSQIVEVYGPTIVLTLAGPVSVGIWYLMQWLRTPVGRLRSERWALRIPLYGRHIYYRVLSQFLRSMATLFHAGLPLNESLALLERSLDRQILKEAVRLQRQAVNMGRPLTRGMRQMGRFFPRMVIELMIVGEETGELPTVLERLARFYDNEMSLGLAAVSHLVEPVVVSILGAVVAFLLLAAFLPIYQLAGSF